MLEHRAVRPTQCLPIRAGTSLFDDLPTGELAGLTQCGALRAVPGNEFATRVDLRRKHNSAPPTVTSSAGQQRIIDADRPTWSVRFAWHTGGVGSPSASKCAFRLARDDVGIWWCACVGMGCGSGVGGLSLYSRLKPGISSMAPPRLRHLISLMRRRASSPADAAIFETGSARLDVDGTGLKGEPAAL